MSIKKDMKLASPTSIPWRLAVLVPSGLDHPGLADTLDRRLWPLLRRRARVDRIDLLAPTGGAVAMAVGRVAALRGWTYTGLGSAAETNLDRRTAVCLLGHADAAVLVFVEAKPPPDLLRLAGLADWLGVPYRWVSLTDEPAAQRLQ